MIRICAPKDFFAGLLFIGIGALGAAVAFDYAFGTATRMGPGYLPSVLSWCTIALGVAVLVRSFAIDGEPVSRVMWRPLVFVLGAIVLFGLLMLAQVGLIPAIIATAIVASLASSEMRWIELLLLSVGLALFCAAVFVYGLGQPIQLWPW